MSVNRTDSQEPEPVAPKSNNTTCLVMVGLGLLAALSIYYSIGFYLISKSNAEQIKFEAAASEMLVQLSQYQSNHKSIHNVFATQLGALAIAKSIDIEHIVPCYHFECELSSDGTHVTIYARPHSEGFVRHQRLVYPGGQVQFAKSRDGPWQSNN